MIIIKKFFKGWNAFEYIFLAGAIIVPVTVGVIFKSWVIEIIANIILVMVALLFAKAKIESYFLGFVSSTLYAIVSYRTHLYGEVVVSLALLLPVCIYGAFNWLRNKFNDNRKGQVVKIVRLRWFELLLLVLSQVIMGVGYYFMLKAFNTDLLLISTFSIATSFMATYLAARRCSVALFAWFVNDFVVLGIWIMIVINGVASSAVMIVMPCMYLISDTYGIFQWAKLKKSQQ
ncbi:MAG: nicotinamide riboside transporter PnuC [Christensenellaceae bacterium]|jgi:nicotinamide mononucleotide transporter PnuC|nr:nicotinamide riboside transporter PnuC [Christensenellaceae bacterium]